MPNDQETKPSQEQGWINIHEPYDLRDWAIYFSVSKEKLKESVLTVGPMVEDVKKYLGK
jgi:hypothetical protein